MLTNKRNNIRYTKVLGCLVVCYDCLDEIKALWSGPYASLNRVLETVQRDIDGDKVSMK